eukprot:RCo027175
MFRRTRSSSPAQTSGRTKRSAQVEGYCQRPLLSTRLRMPELAMPHPTTLLPPSTPVSLERAASWAGWPTTPLSPSERGRASSPREPQTPVETTVVELPQDCAVGSAEAASSQRLTSAQRRTVRTAVRRRRRSLREEGTFVNVLLAEMQTLVPTLQRGDLVRILKSEGYEVEREVSRRPCQGECRKDFPGPVAFLHHEQYAKHLICGLMQSVLEMQPRVSTTWFQWRYGPQLQQYGLTEPAHVAAVLQHFFPEQFAVKYRVVFRPPPQ